jgi:hypothetical protein
MFTLSSPFIEPAKFNDRIHGTKSGDTDYKRNTYALCQCVDLTKLSIILEKMVNEDKLNPQIANVFMTQARVLLASMLSENNRIHDL